MLAVLAVPKSLASPRRGSCTEIIQDQSSELAPLAPAPAAFARATHFHNCCTAPRSHMILTTILVPLRSATSVLSSRNAFSTAFTELEGLKRAQIISEVKLAVAEGRRRRVRTASSL